MIAVKDIYSGSKVMVVQMETLTVGLEMNSIMNPGNGKYSDGDGFGDEFGWVPGRFVQIICREFL